MAGVMESFLAARQQAAQQQNQQLQQLGMLSQLQTGMLQQQKTAADLAREEGFRKELGMLGQNPTNEQLFGVVSKYAPASSLLQFLHKDQEYGAPVKIETPEGPRLAFPSRTGTLKSTSHVPYEPERAVGTQYERAFRTLQGLQQKVDSGTSLTPEETMQAETSRAILSQQRMQIDPVTQQPYWAQPLTIPSRITVGAAQTAAPQPAPQLSHGNFGSYNPQEQAAIRTVLEAQARGEHATVTVPAGVASITKASPVARPVNRLPDTTGGRRPLDAGTEKELNAMGDGLSQMNSLMESFKPDFGGFKVEAAGQGAIELGRRLGGRYKEHADWWQAYEQWITDMRAAKFGMTLTGYELQQFNKYRSKPSDSPEVIENNLSRQIDLAEKAKERRIKSLEASGYNRAAIDALITPQSTPTTSTPEERGGPVPTGNIVGKDARGAPPAVPRVRRYNPATGKIE